MVIERDGLAREVLVPQFAVAELAAYRGQVVALHTIEFYEGNQASGNLVPRMMGFLHTEDREFFRRFVNVKGIGARKALKALCEPVRRIATWIESSDAKALTRLPGIGVGRAKAIMNQRKIRPFRRTSELLRIRGIGRITYLRIKPYLRLTNEAASPKPEGPRPS